jgi:aspartate kinase
VRRVLAPLFEKGLVPVVTGFIARSPRGETTTLGRSGSDTTAALLGAALAAKEVVIWTDVDGVLSADPRIVPNAHLLPRLSYREAAEMTYFGAKVLHFPAVLPAIAESSLVIRNSWKPEGTGTVIASSRARLGIRANHGDSRDVYSRWTAAACRVAGIAARVRLSTARLGVSVVMFSQASPSRTSRSRFRCRPRAHRRRSSRSSATSGSPARSTPCARRAHRRRGRGQACAARPASRQGVRRDREAE